MKKIIIVFILIILAIVTGICLYNKRDGIHIIKEESYLNEYYINDGKVYIECTILIKNTYKKDVLFNLNATSEDDVKSGLLKSKQLVGYNTELTSNEFLINQKSELLFTVVFIGEYAGTNIKQDRNMPKVQIHVVK